MENNEIKKEQLIALTNREKLSVSGTKKIISLKPDLIQLDTVFGGLIITGNNLELVNLDDAKSCADLKGSISSLKFIDSKTKEPIFRKIFK